jgi:hypothetical protein
MIGELAERGSLNSQVGCVRLSLGCRERGLSTKELTLRHRPAAVRASGSRQAVSSRRGSVDRDYS